MRRRQFITLVSGAVVAWPLAARAQQNDRTKRIGVLLGATTEHDPESEARLSAFRRGLEELGWIDGRNIRIEYRFAGGDADRIRTYVTELVKSAPDLIVANSSPVIAELKQATGTIPIIFAVVNDPVSQGFVTSLAHPGGNITGFTLIEFEIVGKWLELLKEMAPRTSRAKLLFNPVTAPFFVVWLRDIAAVSVASIELEPAPVHDRAEIEATMAALAREPGMGLITAADVFTVANRSLIMGLAERYRLPAMYQFRQFAAEGGLISYGPDTADIFHRAAAYVDRILKGANPADLPVQQPSKFQLVLNLKTAKALGLTAPPSLLARADEVIE
ncbi:putative ABC transport system substrate-binding protein [Bradyrhizobium sp. Rc2d]|uniref:ABC transporter substrate-binding protein n=1 Tax=Bradyrhizobium sp. Rc2d TaxID=1855321 RepID=UPI000891E973|nr:ABC transporter substrate-binding protein [Bradyrhizobium sp. Rc2d]SDJ30377.1 putative ABC transport system substrate-binding protein [Bradyrhizobium sp. Rc2d]